ncbi:endonuclease V [Pseudanabaena sp. 'Roaring Creek']|uniref:endonuclease V n=1 Tax=Pseudanabaena sp. 'Roaring Creek' TaxID=1681830 RepID=UPI0006D8072B|nr:endonuclease V [Pseudanabaena sp. 'Roaring Creek']
MIFAVDVDYRDGEAIAAGIIFNDWSDNQPLNKFIIQVDKVGEYKSGEFYRRELPIILLLLEQLEKPPQIIIIDGYVYLDRNKKCGLGGYLYSVLKEQIAVIGVAKTRYRDIPSEVEVFRAGSNRPLYVTAIGIDEMEVRSYIEKMHGDYRIPTMLKIVDRLGRDYISL